MHVYTPEACDDIPEACGKATYITNTVNSDILILTVILKENPERAKLAPVILMLI